MARGRRLRTTELSDRDWNRDKSDEKCEGDRENLSDFVGAGEFAAKNYVTPEDAKSQLRAKTKQFAAESECLAIKATAGLGKTTEVCDIIKNLPNVEKLSIEICVPTKLLGHEIAEKLRPHVDVQVFEGRSAENCDRFDLVQPTFNLGGGTEHRICNNKSSGVKCDFYDTCGFYQQSQDSRPKVRIYAQNYLNIPRPPTWPVPALVIVDESILSQMYSTEHINGRLLSVAYRLDFNTKRKFKADPTAKRNSEYIDQKDLHDVQDIAGNIDGAIQRGEPILTSLRSEGVLAEDLIRAAKVTRALRPYWRQDPSMTVAQHERALNNAMQKRVKDIHVLALCFELLAKEIGFDRHNPKSIKGNTERVELAYRNDLIRLEGCQTLFIDADLELDLLRTFIPTLKSDVIDVRYNACVTQVIDKSFSKSSLGFLGDKQPTDLRKSLISLLEGWPDPKTTLVVTYKSLCDILQTKGPENVLPSRGFQFANFGNVRGKDIYKNLDNIIVIGANRPGPGTVTSIANALTFDVSGETPENLERAIYRSIVTSETNQAVARLRLIWNTNRKNVFILSSEAVDFPVDASVTFNDLLNGGGRLSKLVARFGAFPLTEAWLFENAPDLFDTLTAARKWIENNFPVGLETGRFRVKGKGGPKPSRFYSGDLELDPLSRLEQNLGVEVTKYKGPERGFYLCGKIHRELTRHSEIQPLIEMELISGPRLPEP